MRQVMFFAAIIASAWHANPAVAQSCPSYDTSQGQSGDFSYNPADLREGRVSIEVMTNDNGLNQNCKSAQVEISALNGTVISLRNGSFILPAELIQSKNINRVGNGSLALSGSARNTLVGSGKIGIGLLRIAPGQFVPAGTYSADLQIGVGAAPPTPFTIAVVVEPGVRLLSTNTVQDISLGEVSDGSQASTKFFYRTNASLNITAVSENRGKLVHQDGEAVGTIDYQSFLSGQPLDLSTPANVRIAFSSTGDQSEELEVRVAPQPEKFAGRYTDTLTLTFTAN